MPYSPRKILVIKLRSMGDTVLMTAPLNELRRAFPHAEIHAAALTAWAPLLEGHPSVDRIWTYDRHADRAARAKAATRFALKLRKERFDCVVNLHASPSSAMISFATGARLRSIHFHGHRHRNRYSTVEVPGKGIPKPIIERDMDAVRALGLSIPEGRLPSLKIEGPEADGNDGKPVLALALGASRPTKSWPIERFATSAIEWCRSTAGTAIAIVGPGEERLKADFLKAVDDQLTATVPDAAERSPLRTRIRCESQLRVRELAALLKRSTVVLGNDSGPRHLAVAVGTPTVTLFGPEHPFEWHPYPTAKHPFFFIENLACRKDALPGMPPWCGLDLCTQEQYKCMRQIGTDAVLEKCMEISQLPKKVSK